MHESPRPEHRRNPDGFSTDLSVRLSQHRREPWPFLYTLRPSPSSQTSENGPDPCDEALRVKGWPIETLDGVSICVTFGGIPIQIGIAIDSLFSPYAFEIFTCCSGLAISSTDLGTRLSRDRYPILVKLYSKGICGLVSMATEMFGFSPQRNNYINKCDLCMEVRTFLTMQDKRISAELAPEEFYNRN